MTEYWLQKKTIGGWSHVTYYTDVEQAKINYKSASEGNSGYSWRLVSVEVIECKMLEDVVEVKMTNGSTLEFKPDGKEKINSWEAPVIVGMDWGKGDDFSVDWKPSQDAPKSPDWGGTPAWGDFKAGDDPGANAPAPADAHHGLSGSVWVINHTTKHKSRVPANELENYLNKGYEKGGPRTGFREI